MNSTTFVSIVGDGSRLLIHLGGELNLHTISKFQLQTDLIKKKKLKYIKINLDNTLEIDTAAALYINNLVKKYRAKNIVVDLVVEKKEVEDILQLVQAQILESESLRKNKKHNTMERLGESVYNKYIGIVSFFDFLGNLFAAKLYYLKSINNIRFKEIAFEINESGVKALPIIAITSFLIGLVVAYQSAFQLKLYGANIFLVDMLGISILRELAPLITAIVIAGRSGSAFTAQIGAMKITEELDAMRTMGFDPYIFLVLPRIIALMIALPLLIFLADIMGILGGMLVATMNLQITPTLFLDRFIEVISIEHFYIGIIKGPFFAFLIASIGIYRGLMVENDTQSIGINTTKTVVEAIFAVIVCDALFSITLTNLGI